MANRTISFAAKGYDFMSALNVPGNLTTDGNSPDVDTSHIKDAILASFLSLGPDPNGLLNKTFTVSYQFDDAGTNGLTFTIAVA